MYMQLDHTHSFNGNKHTCIHMHLVRLLYNFHFLVVSLALHSHSVDVHQFCVVSHLLHLSCATGIVLTLNNVQYTNNSVVNITDIGTGSAPLICTTTGSGCCLSTDGSHWYFPDGSAVQRSETLPYYRTRTISHTGGGTVRLHRNPGATTTGVFRCDILDASRDLQSIYVGIYTATTGESCTLKNTKFLL